jgi:hypothetical protein
LMCRWQYYGLAGPPYYMRLPYELQILVDTVNSCQRSNTRKIVQSGKSDVDHFLPQAQSISPIIS